MSYRDSFSRGVAAPLCARLLLLAFLAMAARRPAAAQVDLTGDWEAIAGERDVTSEIADYLGLPINEAARVHADTWTASRLSLVEHQCAPHIYTHMTRAPFPLRISTVRDPETQELTAIKIYFKFMEQTQTIWMDGRPHPSEFARHLWQGFSTGRWDKDVLVIDTTHLKRGWLKRNGVPESDLATSTDHWMRHGNYLSHTTYIHDPVYLTEPLFRADNYMLDTNVQGNWLYPCEPSVEENPSAKKGEVPNYLFGENPFLQEFAKKRHVPFDASRGGAETMYPDYQQKLKSMQ
jgi:hypothetical protein